MSTLSPDQIKSLEQSRQRLIQLTHSLGSLITSLNQSDPLPSWPSLQSQASIISSNLLTLSTHLSENHDLLRSISAYPSPEFPTRTHGNTLEQLLRTKLDPRVEDWVGRGRKSDNNNTDMGLWGTLTSNSAAGLSSTGQGLSGEGNVARLSEGDLAALWEWAPVEANSEARRRNWGGDFTLEERERGVQSVAAGLGLRRVLEDDEDESEEEEEEEEEDEMEVVGVRKSVTGSGFEFDIAAASGGARQEGVAPVVPLDDILRYMTTGIPPR
ncbi:mediator of RNA polymerase II transcription subunit 8 [Aspergillus cavernicola]|uniref:Mediator of RNA polymerase II transcription subunit 8 n=1 Tax=Aspergillus cavernicola TaxID=176166 RepID=A0ABR4HTP7_9EURO